MECPLILGGTWGGVLPVPVSPRAARCMLFTYSVGPALQARKAATPDPFWTCSSAPQASAQSRETREPHGLCAAPERSFHLCALVPVPRPGFSPGKHFSQSNKEDSFLLPLLTDDSFLMVFSVGSCKSFSKTCVKFILQNTRIYVAPTMCEALF